MVLYTPRRSRALKPLDGPHRHFLPPPGHHREEPGETLCGLCHHHARPHRACRIEHPETHHRKAKTLQGAFRRPAGWRVHKLLLHAVGPRGEFFRAGGHPGPLLPALPGLLPACGGACRPFSRISGKTLSIRRDRGGSHRNRDRLRGQTGFSLSMAKFLDIPSPSSSSSWLTSSCRWGLSWM